MRTLMAAIVLCAMVSAFNLLDTTNFGTPAGNISNSNAGVITTADDPRNVQLSVRMVW